jgi:alpha-N-arabinofuranosidase
MAVNLGTGTAQSAQELVEYCNFPAGTYWSDLRRNNGADQPHGIKLWCLGNEMDGPWQIGHKTAEEYARIAHETGKMMKMADPSIELVVCGASTRNMPHFATWDARVLEETFEVVDYIALHAYFGCRNDETGRMDFLAAPEVLDRQINDIIAACDFVAAEKKSMRKMNLALDEWNVWYRARAKDNPETAWQVGRSLLEETYDMADVIVVGGLLMTMLDHADRLKIGCLAQDVNVIAPIMTRKGGGAWKQTIYYPFYYTSKYGRGTVLHKHLESPSYESRDYPLPVKYLKTVAVYREEDQEIVFFAINRAMTETLDFEFHMNGFSPEAVIEAIEIHHCSLDAVNTETEEKVAPATISDSRYSISGTTFQASLKPASWNMFRIKVD